MVDFRIEATQQPGSAPAWLREWSAVAAERNLNFVLPAEPLHPFARVLLGAMTSARRRAGLQSRVSGGLAVESLQPITDLRTARELADRTEDAMAALDPPVSPSILRMARFVFEELGANVVQHSGCPETGYGFARVVPERRVLELAFADAGVGFRASLQRNPELQGRVADDADALQLALSPRMTGTTAPRTNMGIGLKTLTDFSDLLGGDLWLASGSAMLHRRTTAGQRTNVIRSVPSWQGSWIRLEAPVG